jgi:branched-chain amino acid transport system ATP-binding protein
MIECIDLSVRYGGIRALRSANIHVAEGEFVALTGANGAGKSTLLRAVLGIVDVAGGEVRFLGRSMARVSTQRRVRLGMGLVPEGRALFAGMTVAENLTLGAYQHLGRRPKARDEDLDRVFALFPRLRARLDQAAGTMSGGEQQMLALARALMGRPRVLVCDEPSTGLAPLLVNEILQTLRRLCDDGVTILLAEQNAAAALRIADRGYVLENGEVVMQGAAESLRNDPGIIRAYLGDAPAQPHDPPATDR